jgi:conjugal transfer pilus assembly protein TraF
MCNNIIIAIIIMLLTSGLATAETGNTWFQKKDEGWFFYKTKPKPPQKAPKENPPEPVPAYQPPTPAKPAHIRVREHGELLLGNAMVNPTENNVKKYMEYQKEMYDAAERFSRVWERVLAQSPDLQANEYYSEDVHSAIQKEIGILAENTGIFFFFRSDCPHCHKQVGPIMELQRKYGYKIIAVSMDGGVLPQVEPMTVLDNGISTRLNIQSVPAIYLASPGTDKIDPISQGGYLSLLDIERRLYYYVKLQTQYASGLMLDLPDTVTHTPAE